jgi:phosphate transport system permease protein
VPSIVTGLFVYALLVVPFKRFSGFAGAVALSIIMLPTITRTTEEVVRMVPHDLFESAIALGAKRWQAVFRVVLPTASRGILAGFIGAASRAMGETAPLMFTAFGSHFLNLNPFEPVSAIPLVIFNYAISPYEDWQQKAWAASLVLTFLVLGGIIVSRRLVYGRFG